VDVFDGTLVLIDQSYGVPVAHAVAASTAQPGLVAPITIGASRYMDGGVAGAPLAPALGHRRIVALTPGGAALAERAAETARAQGNDVLVLTPDADAAQARGPDSQDPSRMRASAESGLRQASLVGAEIAAFWNGTAPRP
jgi:NTE family protein